MSEILSAEVVLRALQRAGYAMQVERGRLRLRGKGKLLPCDQAVVRAAEPELVRLLQGSEQKELFK